MAFRRNDFSYEQVSVFDHYNNMTPRKQKMFDTTWAQTFRNEILYKIDEEPFRVLFEEEGSASRPNFPINVLVGAEILRGLFCLSDAELLERIAFDVRFAYALHLDAMTDDPFSHRTLRRFRQRLVQYYDTTGIDLIKQTMESLAASIVKVMDIDMTNRRMDSFEVEMTAKSMNRKELLYNAISGFVCYLFFIEDIRGIDYMRHYTEPSDHNRVLYYSEVDKAKRDAVLMKDASKLIEEYGTSYKEEKAYNVFVRVVNEQTIVDPDGSRRWRTKEDGGLNSGIMQSTTDPDATFRSKAGKKHKGYVANVEESVGEKGSLITNYDFETNNTSDAEMLENHLAAMEKQEETVTITADGAFDSPKARELAEEKNVRLVTTDLLGKDVDPVYGAFTLNDDQTAVLICPHGIIPESSTYNSRTSEMTVKLNHDDCNEKCPFFQICKPAYSVKKGISTIRLTSGKVKRARLQAEMSTKEFKEKARFRNGVETIPSFFRTVLNIDHMYAYNYSRNMIIFGFKVMAFNAMKLFTFSGCRRAKCA